MEGLPELPPLPPKWSNPLSMPRPAQVDPPEYSAEEVARIMAAFEEASRAVTQALAAFAPALAAMSATFQRIINNFTMSIDPVLKERTRRLAAQAGTSPGAHRTDRDDCTMGECSHIRSEDCLKPVRPA